jgi:hypothetical protein
MYHFFRPPPNLQFFGDDCKALAVTCGVAMNLAPILASRRKVAISTLISSDISCIMSFLSDDGTGRVLESIQRAGTFSDESNILGLKRFEPRWSQFAIETEPNPNPNPIILLTT